MGENAAGVTSANENVKLRVGYAGNIIVERKLMDSQCVNEVFNEKKRAVRYELVEQYRIAVKNREDSASDVRVLEHIAPPWTMLEQSHKFERKSAGTIRFDLMLEPNSTETITYLR
ncbi:MAG: hypothetical protein ACUVTZ_06805 [Armatimonadota bacterium]